MKTLRLTTMHGRNALEMRFEGDMLLLRPKDAPPAWYGDWELQTMKGDGSEVEDRPQG